MATKTRAAIVFDKREPMRIETVELRAPAAGEVRVRFAACGVCHSDLHAARNDWRNTRYPVVPGHEIVGEVTAVGAAVNRFKAGDRVAVGCLVDSCKDCRECEAGREQYCQKGATLTYNG